MPVHGRPQELCFRSIQRIHEICLPRFTGVGRARSQIDLGAGAAGKFDIVFTVCGFIARKKDRQAADEQDSGYNQKQRPKPHPVYLETLQHPKHRQRLIQQTPADEKVKDKASYKQGRKHIRDKAQHHYDSKSLDFFGSHHQQNQGRGKRRRLVKIARKARPYPLAIAARTEDPRFCSSVFAQSTHWHRPHSNSQD